VAKNAVRDIFSFGSIHGCYLKCRKNKRNTVNALKFEIKAGENIAKLEAELKQKTYNPSRSLLFFVKKPKLREIFAADFRDRVVHHVLVGYLERKWEKIFIYDSYACRGNKGTHSGAMRLRSFIRRVTEKGARRAYYLQLDIKSFFINIDKRILFDIVRKRTNNTDIMWLAEKVIFHDCTKDYILRDRENLAAVMPRGKSLFGKENKKGIPIGNLTSQFFANVYLNELDQFVKHVLKCRYYIRYADDFVLLDGSREKMLGWLEDISLFLAEKLKLELNPKSTKLRPVSDGIDFLGYIVRKDYVLIRRRVVNNMEMKLRHMERLCRREMNEEMKDRLRSTVQSYLGHYKWGNTYRLREKLAKRPVIADHFDVDGYRLIPKCG
jgi:RNA-directed DNA polymerase